jgi:cell division protein FtsN
MIKWIIYILALLGFLWFVFIRNSPMSDFPRDDQGNIRIGEYSDSSEYEDTDDPIDDESAFVEEEPIASIDTTPVNSDQEELLDANKRFLIVVGSFGDRSNAEKMLEKVLDDGHDGKIIFKEPLYRVIAAATDDLNDAKQLQDHFTHAYGVKAFVLKN